MESRNRSAASTYINNLLLSRGFLRDGAPIDFATPEKATGGVDATMAKIMNLVHDLVLQRDREVDTLGNLSQTLQTLRTTSTQQTQAAARLEARNADISRQLAFCSAQEQTAKRAAKEAEARTKSLKEDMQRIKGTVGQIRQQCANDVRRRDQELARLKRHLEGRRGREGNGGQIGVTVITPGISKPPPGSKSVGARVDLASSQYNLRQETTEFLTQLSQGLSDENDALIALVRETLSSLRNLQGLPPDPVLRTSKSHEIARSEFSNAIMTIPPSYEALAASTDEVMASLHGLLTNPSFVPLEEVHIRDEEILKLRSGWERMESRWREAVALMDGWRQRMEHTGDTINLDDLRMGMDLGAGLPEAPSPSQRLPNLELDEKTISEDTIVLEDPHEKPTKPSSGEDDEAADIQRGGSGGSTGHESPVPNVLKPQDGNARPPFIPRKVSFPAIPEENTKAIRDFEDELIFDLCKGNGPPDLPESASPVAEEVSTVRKKPTLTRQLLMRKKGPSSPRSIQQKLERARTEADEARKREERSGKRRSGVVKKLRGSRRRSTLSPEELEKLMGIV
ncbi:MAG: hypothetical protein Q9222_003882 [Ikaeria aurantiellina]